MKRMLAMTMVCMMLSCGTAFAAERPTAFLVDGVRTELKHDLYQKDGKTMISVEDLARATGGWLQQSEEGDHVKLTVNAPVGDENSIWLRNPERSVGISYWREAKLPRYFVRSEQTENHVLYVPFRETVEKLFYRAEWDRGEQNDFIRLNNWKPQISARAEYQKDIHKVAIFITNNEAEPYMIWHDFRINRWNGEAWELVPGIERDMDRIIFPGNGTTTKEYYYAGNYDEPLPTGSYRIIFSVAKENGEVQGEYMVSGAFTVQ